MKILKTETIFNGKFLRFKRKYFENKNGEKGEWEYVERKISPTFVTIFALTKKKEVILERIYKIPFEKWFIELPAGLCDKKEESEVKTARRELLEETGYQAKKLIPIFKGKVSSGITEEGIFYFTKNTELVKNSSLDLGEEIKVIKVPLNKLVDFILNPPKNTGVDVKILSILPILEKKKLI